MAAVAGLVIVPLVVVGLGFWNAPTKETPVQVTPTAAEPPQVETEPTDSGTETTPATPAKQAKVKRALFFGDSLFIGGGYTTEGNSMANLAANRLNFNRRWINGGGGTGYVTSNPEYDLPTFLGQIRDGAFDVPSPGVVVIEGGNNDRGYPPKDIRRNAGKVIRQAKRRHPGVKVVVLGPIDSNEKHSDLKPIMRAVRKAARANHVPFINGVGWLEGHYDLIGPDYDHPTPAGHRLLGRKLAKELRARGVAG